MFSVFNSICREHFIFYLQYGFSEFLHFYLNNSLFLDLVGRVSCFVSFASFCILPVEQTHLYQLQVMPLVLNLYNGIVLYGEYGRTVCFGLKFVDCVQVKKLLFI